MEKVNEKIKHIEEKDSERIGMIRNIIKEKDYDVFCLDQNGVKQEVLTLLLYEYALGIEKITEGNLKMEYTLGKLTGILGKLRFGWWKDTDVDVKYGKGIDDPEGVSVTSPEYKNLTRNFRCSYL